MISTQLKNISQNGNLPQIGMKIISKNKKALKPPPRYAPFKSHDDLRLPLKKPVGFPSSFFPLNGWIQIQTAKPWLGISTENRLSWVVTDIPNGEHINWCNIWYDKMTLKYLVTFFSYEYFIICPKGKWNQTKIEYVYIKFIDVLGWFYIDMSGISPLMFLMSMSPLKKGTKEPSPNSRGTRRLEGTQL